MKINLHIERLVLDGVNIEHGQRHLLQAGVETELTRMLTESGLSPDFTRNLVLSRLSTSAFQMPEVDNTKHVGQEIAKSVFVGIGHE